MTCPRCGSETYEDDSPVGRLRVCANARCQWGGSVGASAPPAPRAQQAAPLQRPRGKPKPQSKLPGLGRLPETRDQTSEAPGEDCPLLDSGLERRLWRQLRDKGLPEPVPGFQFLRDRQYKADFAYLQYRLLIEVEGGTWMIGRHNRPEGFELDCKKYRAASLAGWILLRYTGDEVRSGEAARELETVLRQYERVRK